MNPNFQNAKSSTLNKYSTEREERSQASGGTQNPDLFTFKIEAHLLKITFYLVAALTDALQFADLVTPTEMSHQYSILNKTAIQQPKGNPLVRVRYDEHFWKRIPTNLVNIQDSLNQTILSCAKFTEVFRKGAVKLAMYENAGETAIQTEMINCIFPPLAPDEFMRLATVAQEMCMFSLALVIQTLERDEIDRKIKMQAKDVVKFAMIKTSLNLETFEQIHRPRPKASIGGTLKNSIRINANRSVNTAQRMDEEDSGMQERAFTNFLKKYFPRNS